jgi:AraC family transcriptional activator of pyochelin receptor
MQATELTGETVSRLHRGAGAKGYQARDDEGVTIDPVMQGRATRLAFGGGLAVSMIDHVNEVSLSEMVAPAGRMLSLFLGGGSCDYAVDEGPARAVRPGQAVFAASAQDYVCKLRVERGRSYRFVAIAFDESLIAERAGTNADDDPLLRLLDLGMDRPYCGTALLAGGIGWLADELYGYPTTGACAGLLAEARTLEIVARLASAFANDTAPTLGADTPVLRLSSADVERLHEAKRLVETELDAPLTLMLLARRVGINVNKLKAGFKLLFGRTVTEHAIETRLAFAHDLLRSSELPISSVAYRVGYDPAHFSVAFKRRYGIQPSRIARSRH